MSKTVEIIPTSNSKQWILLVLVLLNILATRFQQQTVEEIIITAPSLSNCNRNQNLPTDLPTKRKILVENAVNKVKLCG